MSPSGRFYHQFGVSSPFDPQEKLVTSPLFSPFALALFRLAFASYTLFTALFVLIWEATRSHDAQSYVSYFTDLSYIGLCSWFWASGVQTLAYALGRGKGYPLQRWPQPLQFLHVLLYSTITTFPIIVTIVFWAVLSSSHTFASRYSSWSNISQHAMNTAFALFEVLFTHAGPSPWSHLPFLIILLACYLAVAYITHVTQGFYTYSFLDPAKGHGRVAGYVFGIAIAEIIVFALMYGICTLRERIAARWRYEKTFTHSQEALDDWEEVERPKTPPGRVPLSGATSRET